MLNLFARLNNVSPDFTVCVVCPFMYGYSAFQVVVPTIPSGFKPKLRWKFFTAV